MLPWKLRSVLTLQQRKCVDSVQMPIAHSCLVPGTTMQRWACFGHSLLLQKMNKKHFLSFLSNKCTRFRTKCQNKDKETKVTLRFELFQILKSSKFLPHNKHTFQCRRVLPPCKLFPVSTLQRSKFFETAVLSSVLQNTDW